MQKRASGSMDQGENRRSLCGICRKEQKAASGKGNEASIWAADTQNIRNIYNSNLSHRAKSVYMYLKDRADSEGRCWPAIRTIALELGLSRSTVKRALDDLCKTGLLQKYPRWRENGSLTSNLYHVV